MRYCGESGAREWNRVRGMSKGKSGGAPRSCQAQGAPLAPGEWPRVCSGILSLTVSQGHGRLPWGCPEGR